MKKTTHASQSTLFLMELIISTAYMALASVVCVRLYLYAHTISADSSARTHAITQAQNMIISFRSGDGTLTDAAWSYQETAEKFPGVLNELRALSDAPDAAGITELIFDFDEDWYLTGVQNGTVSPDQDSSRDEVSPAASPLEDDTAAEEKSPYYMTAVLKDSTETPGIRILTITISSRKPGQDEVVYSTEYDEYVPDDAARDLSGGASPSAEEEAAG